MLQNFSVTRMFVIRNWDIFGPETVEYVYDQDKF